MERDGGRKIWIAAGVAAAVAVSALSLWHFAGTVPNKKPGTVPAELSPRGRIPDAEPSAAPTNSASSAPARKAYKEMSNAEKLKYYRDKYGENIPDNLKPIVYYLENVPKRNFRPPRRDPASIFKHRSEREIASFLLVEPGTRMMRPVEFGERFDRDLAAALSAPTEAEDGDTEEQRRLKEAVAEVRDELAERAKAGENPSAVMTEAAKELYLLGRYRDDIEAEIRAIKNDPSKTDDDLSLAVEAANKMLARKGIKPLRQPNMLIRRANLKKARKRKENAE